MLDFTIILVAGGEFFHTQKRKDGRDDADGRFSQLFCDIPIECDVSETEFLYETLQTS
jgi:hypothetical protein